MPIHRVLLVENVREQRRALRSELLSLDQKFEITDVASGEEALLVLASQPVDLLVTEFHLAGISGVELMRKARQRQAELKVILLAKKTDLAPARQAGGTQVDFILTRPVESATFLGAVEQCLGPQKAGKPKASVDHAAAQAAQPEPVVNPAERLENLRRELLAAVVLLLDEHGQIIAQAGELPLKGIKEDLLQTVLAASGPLQGVSRALGSVEPAGFQFWSGVRYAACAAPAGATRILLVIQENAPKGKSPERLFAPVLAAAQELSHLPVEKSASGPVQQEKVEPKVATMDTQPLKIEPDPVFEKMFHQASSRQMKAADVDKFWDNLAGQAEIGSAVNDEAISYEQARRMGLAPSEGKS